MKSQASLGNVLKLIALHLQEAVEKYQQSKRELDEVVAQMESLVGRPSCGVGDQVLTSLTVITLTLMSLLFVSIHDCLMHLRSKFDCV